MYRFNYFTEKANHVINLAITSAEELGHNYIGSEHLLLGILKEDAGLGAQALRESGVQTEDVEKLIKENIGVGEPTRLTPDDFTPRFKRMLELAFQIARGMMHSFVGTEHLLLALLKETDSYGYKFLLALGVRPEVLVEQLFSGQETQPDGKTDGKKGKTKTPTLDEFGRDLTALAEGGKIDPVIGREKEIERVIQILSRRSKNNPCLIGEPGVGKTAIAEGLALKIVKHEVPELLEGKKIVALDLTSMVAGTKYRGDFEERIQKAMDEVKQAGNIILFIDEVHTLMGAGSAEGATDAANILKPALARGEIQVIGATTIDEYRKNIEKDAALERRFQPVQVDQPTVEDTISILRGLKERYEVYHGVKIQDAALIAAATLSNRYISDRFLPDKAIDLVDEACAMIRTEMDSMPIELDELNRKIIQQEIAQAALKKEEDKLSKERLETVTRELAQLREQFNSMKAQWDNEKAAITKVQKLREEIEQVGGEIERAEREYDLNKAAELKYGKLPQLKAELEKEEKLAEEAQQSNLLRDKVTEEEIAKVVGKWTGIPVARIMEGEREKLLHMEDILHENVVGQDEAVRLVSEAILRSRAGISDPNRPIGSFLFLGPTGVGKTQLAKTLAKTLFDDENNMVRIDMSEYMEKYSVSRLIGAPPGYVGYEEGGQLTEAVRRHPYSVVLFDEVEKAHPDVFNVLLQVLDDGRITDSQGRTVDFKNTIIILTSNLGSSYILEGITPEGEISQEAKDQVNALLKSSFRPEFLNRLDEIVFYKPLSKENIGSIIDLQMKDLRERLKAKQITLEMTDAAKQYIIDNAYDPVYGARPLKRFLQSHVETLLAKKIIAGEIGSDDDNAEMFLVTIDAENGELVVR